MSSESRNQRGPRVPHVGALSQCSKGHLRAECSYFQLPGGPYLSTPGLTPPRADDSLSNVKPMFRSMQPILGGGSAPSGRIAAAPGLRHGRSAETQLCVPIGWIFSSAVLNHRYLSMDLGLETGHFYPPQYCTHPACHPLRHGLLLPTWTCWSTRSSPPLVSA